MRYFSVSPGDIVSTGSPARILIAYKSYTGQGCIYYVDHYSISLLAGSGFLSRDPGNG